MDESSVLFEEVRRSSLSSFEGHFQRIFGEILVFEPQSSCFETFLRFLIILMKFLFKISIPFTKI